MSFKTTTAASAMLLALLSTSGVATAAEQGHYVTSNAVDKCQAFTPGPANTIRNRVSGAENVGTAPIAVACVFELDEIYGAGQVVVDDITVWARNNGTATGSAATMSCTLLPGSYQNGFGTATTQSLTPAPGNNASTSFSSLELSTFSVGVNCIVPPNIVLSHLIIRYRNDGA